jgi:hypothetical protein
MKNKISKLDAPCLEIFWIGLGLALGIFLTLGVAGLL